MHVNGKNYRTVWMESGSVLMIEQNLLPFEFSIYESKNYKQTCHAIKTMIVRGAGAIGVTAGYAMAQAFLESTKTNFREYISVAKIEIEATRPTARNLFYAVERVYNAGLTNRDNAIIEAEKLALEDMDASKKIGMYGNELITSGFTIETHCNAGWLAFTDYGTALSPIYEAANSGKNIFVYVDETRPRSQGARLTAWELKNENIPHVIIPDNAGAHLMSLGKIDMVIVGADRIAANGDVANKIGTQEKAIVAHEYGIPFYVAAPTSTFDINCIDGKHIPIEERNPDEILYQKGPDKEGIMHEILVCSPGSTALNPAFDVTPAKFITKIITEKGIINPDAHEIKKLFEK
ncbi:MAG TPA: S-methyl-5-thioribose-1-phosphate isomerase [Bacteroidales bacterium]|nr:S-methyl-5-thioribose-1-phosphate isomerase [Bacteroidales bacterium]